MYWMDKWDSALETVRHYTLVFFLIAVIIWVLNGGKNDFGVIHHLVIYMVLTCFFIMIMSLVLLIAVGIRDGIVYLINRNK